MKQSIFDFAFRHFPAEMVIAHAAEAKGFILQKLRDDKPAHDLMWMLLECNDHSDHQLARLLNTTSSELIERRKRLTEHARSILTEYGIELDNAEATEASMRRNLPFFGLNSRICEPTRT